MASKKTAALVVAGGVLVLGAGIGAATLASADPTPSASPSSGTTAAPGKGPDGRGGPHGLGGGRLVDSDELATKLAQKLGVDQAKVAEAIKAYRDANKPTPPTAPPTPGTQSTPGSKPSPATRPDRDARDEAMAKAIAEKLGIDQAKVTAALDEIRAEAEAAARSEGKTRLSERLASAVKAGTLTQAEADAVLKAYDKGVIGPR